MPRLRPMLVCCSLLLATPTWALSWVEAGVRDHDSGLSRVGDTRADPDLLGEPAVYGRVGIHILADPWDFGAGPLPPGCLNCTSVATIGLAQGSADGDAGVLKGEAYAALQGSAGLEAGLSDVLTVGPGGATLHLDLRIDDLDQRNGGEAQYQFVLGRSTEDPDFPFDEWLRLEVQAGGSWGLWREGSWVDGGSAFDGRIELDWALGGGPVPVSLDIPLEMRLSISADCALADPEDGCRAHIDALHSAYIGIRGDFVSHSGYDWLGAAPPVPEPPAALLLGAGLLGLALRRRG